MTEQLSTEHETEHEGGGGGWNPCAIASVGSHRVHRRHRVLLRGENHLKTLDAVEAVTFDKTGAHKG